MLIVGIIICLLGAGNIAASQAEANRFHRRRYIATGLFTMALGGMMIGFS